MLKGPIALGTIRTTFVLFLRLIIQAGTLLLVARILGPTMYGVFAGIAALSVLLGSLSTFGTQLVLLKSISQDRFTRNDVLSYAIPTTIICSGILIQVYALLAFWLLPENAFDWWVVLAIGIAEIFFQPLFGFVSTEHHALGRIAQAQFIQNSPLALRLLVASIIFCFEISPALGIYVGGYLFASIMVLFLGVYYLPGKWPSYRSWRLPTSDQRRNAIGYAAINISKLGSSELDKMLAIKFLSIDAAGVYSAAARVVGAITLPVTAMILSALPRLFRVGSKTHLGSQHLMRWMYGVGFSYALLLSMLLWLVAPVIEVIFGDEYIEMDDVVRWLCLAIPGITLRLIGGNGLIAMGKPWLRFGFEFFGVVVLVLAGVLLAPNLGIKGMAMAVVFAEWTMGILAFLLIILMGKSSTNSNLKV